MKKFKIDAFPTYLFFDPNGKIVHRMIEASDVEQLIWRGSDALDPAKQYYTLLAQYEAYALSNNDKTYWETPDKMKKGEKTWKE